jgi:hypothetical protein
MSKFFVYLLAFFLVFLRFSRGLLTLISPFWWMEKDLNPFHPIQNLRLSLKGRACFKFDILFQNIFGIRHYWTRNIWKKELLKDNQAIGIGKVEQVPGLSLDKIDTIPKFHLDQKPFVFRSFLNQRIDLDHWSFEQFITKYGEEEVLLSCPVHDGYLGQLNEIDIPGVYLQNAESLLIRYPQLLKAMGLDQISATIAQNFMYSGIAQLFAGRKNTGTWLHCAGGMNMFLMLSGQKKWTFYDPAFSYGIFPFTEGRGKTTYYLSSASIESKNFHQNLNRLNDKDRERILKHPKESMTQEMLDLFNSCDRFEVVLNPGDVLFVPAWWWHDVENLTSESIGVATRWYDASNPPLANRVFDMGTRLNLPFFYNLITAALSQDILTKNHQVNLRPRRLVKQISEERSRAVDLGRYGCVNEKVQDYYQRMKGESTFSQIGSKQNKQAMTDLGLL